jgi:AbiV family abortive infection protein
VVRSKKRLRRSTALTPRAGLKLPTPKPVRPWDRALRPYLNASHSAYQNSVSLRDDAVLLFRHKRYARAAALSITGLEEAGKALVLWFIGIGHVPESRRAEVLKAMRSKHTLKQATALPLRVIGQVIPLARRIKFKIPKAQARPKNWSDVERLMREMLPAIIAGAQALVDDAGLASDLSSIGQEAERVMKGGLELRRQRGLYTDLGESTVQSPADVKRPEAGALLRDLRVCLLALKPLADVVRFGDEGMDGVLAASEMHDRIWAPPSPGRTS